MDWIDSLKGLPVPIGILVVFTVCVAAILRSIFRRVVDPLVKSSQDSADRIKEGLDKNSEAVESAVKSNETLIRNHLSRESERWEEVKKELINTRNCVNNANQRKLKDKD